MVAQEASSRAPVAQAATSVADASKQGTKQRCAGQLCMDYFRFYNARDRANFRALFSDDATMTGVTVVVQGGDQVVEACAQLWEAGAAEAVENATEYPRFLEFGDISVSACGGRGFCQVVVQMKAGEKPLRICDVMTCADGKITDVTAYLGRRVE